MKQYVITISRQFGSLGRTIAQHLSEILQIEFYDRDIVEETAKRMGLPVSVISDKEENPNTAFFKRQYPLGMGIGSMQDEIFSIQENIIRDLAKKESCIIVGRCADYALSDDPHCINAFIYASKDYRIKRYVYAPVEARLRNCTEILKMDEKTAKKMIREVDRSRELYHRRYCPEYNGPSTNKDLMIDSSRFGVEKTVDILAGIAKDLFGE